MAELTKQEVRTRLREILQRPLFPERPEKGYTPGQLAAIVKQQDADLRFLALQVLERS